MAFPAADSVRALEARTLAALCVVDMFNEGLDLPAIDRVVLLRPIESRVVFLQQLGRGLWAAPDKPHLTVIDFVGNHRVFLHRMLLLLGLRNGPASLNALRRWLDSETAELPPNCLVRLELEAKEILRALLPRPADAALEIYRGLRGATNYPCQKICRNLHPPVDVPPPVR